MNWKPTRIGYFNIWYHADTEIELSDGKLFIRGDNASGKTIASTLMLPLLLDGNYTPSRLDPQKRTDRLLIDLHLGEEAVNQKKDGNGYLYMEFRKGEQLITIGMGLSGVRKSRDLATWYFIVTNGKQIGKDLLLYDQTRDGKAPLNYRDFCGRFKGSFITEDKADYAKEVNRLLFGFQNIHTFHMYIKLLIELRPPKISKDVGPSIINTSLTDALPELSDKDLESLTNIVSKITEQEELLAKTTSEVEALKKLSAAYEAYQFALFFEFSEHVSRSSRLFENEQSRLVIKENDLQEMTQRQAEAKERIEESEQQITALEVTVNMLKETHQDIFKAEEKKRGVESQFGEVKDRLSQKEAQLRNSKTDVHKNEQTIEEAVRNELQIKDEIQGILDYLTEYEKLIKFDYHDRYVSQFSTTADQIGLIVAWKEEINRQIARLKEIEENLRRYQEQEAKTIQKRIEFENKLEAYNASIVKIDSLYKQLQKSRVELFERIESWSAYHGLSIEAREWEVLQGILSDLYEYGEDEEKFYSWKQNVLESREEPFRIQKREAEYHVQRLTSEIKKVQIEYEQALSAPFVEPPEQKEERLQWNCLDELQIPYIRFFEAVEFKDAVSDHIRKSVESVIQRSGLLQAVIVPKEYEATASGQAVVLRTQAPKSKHLGDLMEPVPSDRIDTKTIESVLQGISVDEHQEGYIGVDGVFRSGFLEGIAPRCSESYVGLRAREEARQRRLLALREQLDELEQHLSNQSREQRTAKAEIDELHRTWMKIPSTQEIKDIYREQDVEKRNAKHRESEKEEAYTHYETIRRETLNVRNQVMHLIGDMDLPLRLDVCSHTLEQCRKYKDEIMELGKLVEKRMEVEVRISQTRGHLESLGSIVEDYQEDYDELSYEQAKLEKTIQRLQEAIDSNSDVFKQIEKANLQLNDTKFGQRQAEKVFNQLTPQIENAKKEVEKIKTAVLQASKRESVWFKQFRKLQIIKSPFSSYTADQILERGSKSAAKREEALEHLLEVENTVRGDLEDYRLRRQREQSWNEESEVKEAIGRTDVEALTRLTSYSTLILQNNNGVPCSPLELLQELSDIEFKLKQNIGDKEKKLFTDIVINEIGRTIQARIYEAGQWVNDVNDRFHEFEGLRIRLDWNAKDAMEDDTLKTKQLVDLLSRNSRFIDPADLEKVAAHFRARIEAVQQRTKKEFRMSRLEAYKEVLDYRKWFIFETRVDKGTGPEKVGNRNFGRYSNGQKAIILYMPLLAAIDAILTSASDAAPRLITLDEAFAGVDSSNKEKMFNMIQDFGFDYIMNSYDLWGCYRSVKSLSIVTILRQPSSPHMGFRRYHWNGKRQAEVE
ncbi:TIGR02680 family protein [Paenibacillus sp. SC116]|uniref:TIGR02680 family protein n=1 Tax=Paenibacillus sp. SC116 TaxID=2968986 RepID=UPI00215A3070|nr:TIGR02680 family protein [Paenibacillus sp. SC116]MCR8844368.1 TIGR02680 family protein [Paenibacillus sp. SC116]